MTPVEALDRIAALCDAAYIDCPLGDAFRTKVRAVLAEVTPEPDYAAVNRSLLRRLKAAQAGGVLDRDAPGNPRWVSHEQVVERAAELQAARGVTLTPEEVRATRDALDLIGKSRHPRFDALAARLEAAS